MCVIVGRGEVGGSIGIRRHKVILSVLLIRATNHMTTKNLIRRLTGKGAGNAEYKDLHRKSVADHGHARWWGEYARQI